MLPQIDKKPIEPGSRSQHPNVADIARQQGLRHLTCMLVADFEKDAVETLRDLGFEEHPIPGYGTDPDGTQHDMVKLVLKL